MCDPKQYFKIGLALSPMCRSFCGTVLQIIMNQEFYVFILRVLLKSPLPYEHLRLKGRQLNFISFKAETECLIFFYNDKRSVSFLPSHKSLACIQANICSNVCKFNEGCEQKRNYGK